MCCGGAVMLFTGKAYEGSVLISDGIVPRLGGVWFMIVGVYLILQRKSNGDIS